MAKGIKAQVGFFQISYVKDGKLVIENSMGRLISFIGAAAGVITVISGIALVDASIVALGVGVFTGGGLLKFGQKIIEGKVNGG